MYGNTPTRWHDQLEGLDRLRVITNYLTRIRFCDEIGTLQLTVKEGLSSAPQGFKPWFEYETLTPEATILFGHWAALEGYTGKKHVFASRHRLCLGSRTNPDCASKIKQLYAIPC